MATVTTSEFVKAREYVASFSMIEHKGIVARLIEESSLAVGDFTRDPRGFIREIFSDDTKDLQRSKRIRMGLAFGLVLQIIVITAIAIAGWHHATAITKLEEPEDKVIWVPKPETSKTPESSKSIPRGTKDGNGATGEGSGGGGERNPLPSSIGQLPQSAPIKPIIPPTSPNVIDPSLAVNPNIVGLPTPPPSSDSQIGVPDGKIGEPSGGPGDGGGMGGDKGPGVGRKSGPGGGDKSDGNRGGSGTPGSPNGSITPTGPIDYAPFSRMPDTTGIIWIRRVRPILTPEAQADKIHGYVVLEATFNADGTITDIIVRQSLDSMDEAAKEALQKAKFRPATIKGVPITLRRVPIKVNVNLN